MYESIEELDDMDKLGQGFKLADPLEEVDIGDGTVLMADLCKQES